MSNINKLVRVAVSILIFCAGIFTMVYEERAYIGTLNLTREKIKEDVLYQQYNVTDREIITYAELVATLLQPLEYDIAIDGNIISKCSHTSDKIVNYCINHNEYIKSYKYNSNGNLTSIEYTSKY